MSCRLRVTLPENAWMARLTRAYPESQVEILDRLAIGRRRVLFDVQLPPRIGLDWDAALRALPGVRRVERLDARPHAEVYRVLFAGRTFLPLFQRLSVLRRFPFSVQDGVATWIVIGPDARVRRLLSRLRTARIDFQVGAVQPGRGVDGPPLLTARQREVLKRAVAEGYFEVPRRISLTELAARLGVASSTVSVTLAVIERKLVGPFVATLPGPPAPDGREAT